MEIKRVIRFFWRFDRFDRRPTHYRYSLKTLRKSADGQPPELLSFGWACLVADNIPKKKFGDAITMDMESVTCKQCRRIITARKQNGLPV